MPGDGTALQANMLTNCNTNVFIHKSFHCIDIHVLHCIKLAVLMFLNTDNSFSTVKLEHLKRGDIIDTGRNGAVFRGKLNENIDVAIKVCLLCNESEVVLT